MSENIPRDGNKLVSNLLLAHPESFETSLIFVCMTVTSSASDWSGKEIIRGPNVVYPLKSSWEGVFPEAACPYVEKSTQILVAS